MLSNLWDWVKLNVSKKFIVTIAMFLLTPYLAKLRASGVPVDDEMVRTILLAGLGYIGIQGLKDAIEAHHEGKVEQLKAMNQAVPEKPVNSDQMMPGA